MYFNLKQTHENIFHIKRKLFKKVIAKDKTRMKSKLHSSYSHIKVTGCLFISVCEESC